LKNKVFLFQTNMFVFTSGMDNAFDQSVYCLSGLGIVRKNRRIP